MKNLTIVSLVKIEFGWNFSIFAIKSKPFSFKWIYLIERMSFIKSTNSVIKMTCILYILSRCFNIIQDQLTWMYLWTPTSAFLRASKLEEYNIFFLMRAVSGHQDMRKSFCFFETSVVPWHWCSYSKSYSP